jgi:hypothetical protein
MVRRVALTLLMVAMVVGAEPLSRNERNRAMSELHATRKAFLDATTGLSAAQWNYKPGTDRWSVGEIAEHLTLTEDGLFQMVTQKLMQTPADPAKRESVKGKDKTVLEMVPDRSTRVEAPEPFRPTGKWSDRQALIEEFKKRRDRTIEYVDTTNDELRLHFAPLGAMGDLDGYQYILMMAAHTWRHLDQMKEVKAAPGYPKN